MRSWLPLRRCRAAPAWWRSAVCRAGAGPRRGAASAWRCCHLRRTRGFQGWRTGGQAVNGAVAVQSEETTWAELLSRHDERGIRKTYGPVVGWFHEGGQPVDSVSLKIIQPKASRLLYLPQGCLGWISTSLDERA